MNETPIVTSCDEGYLPGLKALHNSYLRNSREGFSFNAIISGSQEFADHVKNDLGINVILNPEFTTSVFPLSERYLVANPAMWYRLLVPGLFAEHDKSIYVDTDSLILQNLQPLININLGANIVAATRCNSNKSTNYSPTTRCEGENFGPMASMIVFNHRRWFELDIPKRIAEAMQRTDITWHTIDQAVLQFVVGDSWHMLPWNNQPHAGHETYFVNPKGQMYTLHFMGTKPWREFSNPEFITQRKLQTRELWKTYA